jgi:pyruvate,orthophosphate dikinase
MGKPCVAGAEGISVDIAHRLAMMGEKVVHEGDIITIDGTTGNVYLGEIPTVEPEFSSQLNTLLDWADETASLGVMANADTPEDAAKARGFGAVGIGLCRTERMFNASDRLPIVVDMILADTPEARQAALDRLLPIQRSDFKGILKAMSPYPVTIRLLDPPMHEFLPFESELVQQLDDLRALRRTAATTRKTLDSLKLVDPQIVAGYLEKSEGLQIRLANLDVTCVDETIKKKELMLQRARTLREINPMLGHRGVRLGITNPEIYKMQIRAILEATAECAKENVEVHAEIMVPQVCAESELKWVKSYVDEVKDQVEETEGVELKFKFGTMIEVVRACLTAGDLARVAEFFSFGTNDLTQATFSFSREDAENKFLPFYQEAGVVPDNPFESLDVTGVGKLMKMAIEDGRKTQPGLKIGICGEHGGHPASIRFCHQAGLTYVSCSGPRVPIARLAAAHAALWQRNYDY